MPVPFCWTSPVPEITPVMKGPGPAIDLLIANMPLSTMLPTIDPVVPPSPSCSVPAVMVVPPV